MQSVLNAAARLVFSARKFDHTTSLLCELHWLKVPERIKFRLCVLTHRCLHDMAPRYLAETETIAVFIYYFNCISFAIRLSGRKVAIKLID